MKVCVLLFLLFITDTLLGYDKYSLLQWRFPTIKNFSVNQYKAHRQVWDIVQDEKGRLYFANSKFGILIYDGKNWDKIVVPQSSTIRSLAKGRDGVIYAGGVGEFGFIRRTFGKLQYYSLTKNIPKKHRNFTNVWQTVFTKNGTYFLTTGKIFRWYKNRMYVLTFSGSLARLLNTKYGLYAYPNKRGILKIEGNRLKQVPNSQSLGKPKYRAFVMFSLGRSTFLLVTKKSGIFLFNKFGLKRLASPANNILKRTLPYAGAVLGKDLYAIGTLYAGIVIIDSKGRLLNRIDKKNGLVNDSVLSLFKDRGGNLWVASNSGISRITYNPQFLFLPSKLGFKGNIRMLVSTGKYIYFTTIAGLYRFKKEALFRRNLVFEKVKGFNNSCWAILSVHGGLLFSYDGGFVFLKGKESQRYSGKYTIFQLVRSRKNKNLVYAGTSAGLMLLRYHGRRWQAFGPYGKGSSQVRTVAEDAQGVVWFSQRKGSVLSLKFDYAALHNPMLTEYSSKHGLPNTRIRTSWLGNDLIFWTFKGFYKFDKWEKRFVLDSRFGPEFHDMPIYRFNVDQLGNCWIKSYQYYYAQKKLRKRYFVERFPFLGALGYLDIGVANHEQKGISWFAYEGGLLRYEASRICKDLVNFPALISKVFANDRLVYGYQDDKSTTGNKLILHADQNRVRFYFGLADYVDEKLNQFRYKLEGYHEKWSKWSSENFFECSNLSDGDYRLLVQGRTALGRATPHAALRFTIMPPLYKTWWAYLLYLLFAITIGYLAVAYKVKKVKQREERKYLEKQQQLEMKFTKHEALFAKINTHFLFNTLNAIASLIDSDPVRAEKMVEDLSAVFRYILQFDVEGMIQLKKELLITEAYLNIESVRLGKRLRWNIDVDPLLGDFMMPQLILQPLIENSIKYNIARSIHGGEISISASVNIEKKRVIFRIEDYAEKNETVVTTRNVQSGEGIALKNIRDRLQLLYGELVRFSNNKIETENEIGYLVVIEVPWSGEDSLAD